VRAVDVASVMMTICGSAALSMLKFVAANTVPSAIQGYQFPTASIPVKPVPLDVQDFTLHGRIAWVWRSRPVCADHRLSHPPQEDFVFGRIFLRAILSLPAGIHIHGGLRPVRCGFARRFAA